MLVGWVAKGKNPHSIIIIAIFQSRVDDFWDMATVYLFLSLEG